MVMWTVQQWEFWEVEDIYRHTILECMYFVEKTTDSGVEYYILDLLFDYTIVEHGFLL
jgi:hypothetical protein